MYIKRTINVLCTGCIALNIGSFQEKNWLNKAKNSVSPMTKFISAALVLRQYRNPLNEVLSQCLESNSNTKIEYTKQFHVCGLFLHPLETSEN